MSLEALTLILIYSTARNSSEKTFATQIWRLKHPKFARPPFLMREGVPRRVEDLHTPGKPVGVTVTIQFFDVLGHNVRKIDVMCTLADSSTSLHGDLILNLTLSYRISWSGMMRLFYCHLILNPQPRYQLSMPLLTQCSYIYSVPIMSLFREATRHSHVSEYQSQGLCHCTLSHTVHQYLH